MVLSHIYLIVGCALPVWLTYLLASPSAGSSDLGNICAAASGIVFVGLGMLKSDVNFFNFLKDSLQATLTHR